MALGKQSKILTDRQVSAVLHHLSQTRYPERDRVMLLLSVKAGLRAKEIALLTWDMVTDANGEIGDCIALRDEAAKGNSGRIVPIHRDLQQALIELKASAGKPVVPTQRVIHSERGAGLSAGSVAVWFHRLYRELGYEGCSSHSGRRTFITKAAKKIVEAGGSIRDVQQLAGHTNLSTTQRYIEGDSDAKRRVVSLI